MKKLLLFLTVFLFFAFVIAEEVQVGEYTVEDVTITLFEEREPEPEPELEPEPEKEPELQPEPEEEPEPEPETEPEKEPEFFYIQPAVEIGAAMGIFFG